MNKINNIIASISLPSGFILNMSILFNKELISFLGTLAVTIVAIVSGIIVIRSNIKRKKLTELEIECKKIEYAEMLEEIKHNTKLVEENQEILKEIDNNNPKDPPGFFKNNVIK